MTDLVLETVRALLVGLTAVILYSKSRKRVVVRLPGSRLIVVGLLLLFVGMLLDVSDNFPSLNRFVFLGDTPYEAFGEKVVGSLLAYALVGIGLLRWVPAWIEHDRSTRTQLDQTKQRLKDLRGLVPICSYCRKIRDDAGFWSQIEQYIVEHSDAEITHGMCPDCYERVIREDEVFRDPPGAGAKPSASGNSEVDR